MTTFRIRNWYLGLNGPHEKSLSELADYRKIHGTAFLTATAKTPLGCGSEPKESIQVAPRRKEIDYDHSESRH
jgi:hypothetical protein